MQSEILSHPYQIYSEISNVGKNFAGTKKAVKWRFGWSNSEKICEIEFKHSQVSGKKQIFENGRKVAEGEATMGTEYTYGWNSHSCPNHIFRIEAELGVTDQTYFFSIDGQNYNSFPREAVHTPNALPTSNSNTSRSIPVGGNKKASPIVASKQRSDFQSPGDATDWGAHTSSDPFASSSDPFGDKPNNGRSGGGGGSVKNAPRGSSDPFGDSRGSGSLKNTPRGGSADPFGDSPVSSRNGGGNTDFFGESMSTPVAKPVQTNPAPTSRTQATTMNKSASPTNKSSSNAFKSTAPAFDLLNDDAPLAFQKPTKTGNYLDDFAELSTGGGSSLSATTSPAKDVFDRLNDPFAPKPVIVPTATNQATVNTGTISKTTSPSKTEFDLMDSGLVSLDLNPKQTAGGRSTDKTRKEEYEKNLPLNTLMGNVNKTQVMMSEPMVQPPPMRMMSSADSISALGPRPPMMGGPMGMGQPQPFGMTQQQPMGMGGMYGQPRPMGGMYGGMPSAGQLGSGSMMGGNPFGGPAMGGMSMQQPPRPMGGTAPQYGSYGSQSTTQSKPSTANPFDSLDWKM